MIYYFNWGIFKNNVLNLIIQLKLELSHPLHSR